MKVPVQEVIDAMYDASVIERIRTHGIAPPDGCEVVSYFYSGPQGFFYVPTMGQGEIILSLMNVDEEDWTATKLATLPSVDALIAEIEAIVKCAKTATDGDTGDTIYIGEAYPEDEVKAILDKYRNVK